MEAFRHDILPGLPGHVALECLLRVPPLSLPKLRAVSQSWNSALRAPYFVRLLRLRLRVNHDKLCGQKGKFLVIFVECRRRCKGPEEYRGANRNRARRQIEDDDDDKRGYRPIAYDLIKRKWSNCVSLRGSPPPLPFFTQMFLLREKLVVLGFRGSDEPPILDSRVWAYDFAEGEWREGAPMPGPVRKFYDCGTDGIGTILVAGGRGASAENQRFSSAMVYDVESDEWIALPRMLHTHTSRLVSFHGHKFYLGSSSQALDSQALDLINFSWSAVVAEGEKAEMWRDVQHHGYGRPCVDWTGFVQDLKHEYVVPDSVAVLAPPKDDETSHNNNHIRHHLPGAEEIPTCVRGFSCVPFVPEKILVWD